MKRLLTVVLGAVWLVGCAGRGEVKHLRADVAALSATVSVVQAQQMAAPSPDTLRNDLRTVSAEVVALETKLADAAVQIGRLAARLDALEQQGTARAQAMEALNANVTRLTAMLTPPPPPPAPPPAPARPREPAPNKAAPTAEQAYAAALGMFRAREHGQAVLDFLDFLARYPRHPLAANAQYWIGEAYYIQRDYRQALVEFGKVLDHGPGNAKVPDALLKAGLCHRNLRDPARASELWQRVIRDHPKSEAAAKARGFLRAAHEVKRK